MPPISEALCKLKGKKGPPLTRTHTASLLSLGAFGKGEMNLKDLPKRCINALAWELCGRDVALHRA